MSHQYNGTVESDLLKLRYEIMFLLISECDRRSVGQRIKRALPTMQRYLYHHPVVTILGAYCCHSSRCRNGTVDWIFYIYYMPTLPIGINVDPLRFY